MKKYEVVLQNESIDVEADDFHLQNGWIVFYSTDRKHSVAGFNGATVQYVKEVS